MKYKRKYWNCDELLQRNNWVINAAQKIDFLQPYRNFSAISMKITVKLP